MADKKKSGAGVIPNQPEDHSVWRDDLPISCELVDGPHCSDINRRNQIHDYEEIRGKVPRNGGIAKFIRKG